MLRYVLILILLMALSLWLYNFMINICPKRNCPKRGRYDHSIIEDLNERLRVHIIALAEEIGTRNVLLPEKLNATAEYIQQPLAGEYIRDAPVKVQEEDYFCSPWHLQWHPLSRYNDQYPP